jgi:hypothetical protein
MSKPPASPKYVAPRFTDCQQQPQEQQVPESELEELRKRVQWLEQHMALIERMISAVKKNQKELMNPGP